MRHTSDWMLLLLKERTIESLFLVFRSRERNPAGGSMLLIRSIVREMKLWNNIYKRGFETERKMGDLREGCIGCFGFCIERVEE